MKKRKTTKERTEPGNRTQDHSQSISLVEDDENYKKEIAVRGSSRGNSRDRLIDREQRTENQKQETDRHQTENRQRTDKSERRNIY